MGWATKAFMHPAAEGGHRFYLHHIPQSLPQKGAVLYLHPWAEEMNKSRRMAAIASRALAEQGWAVLQVDLWGCGDSGGDFGDATWAGWIEDAVTACHWLRERHPEGPLWLWGLRNGCLLARETAQRLDQPADLLMWQPTLQGRLVVQQFLRLGVAARMADGGGKAAMTEFRGELAAGRPVEIAGYRLHPDMARGLEAALMEPIELSSSEARRRLAWLEVSSHDPPSLTPASTATLERWALAGWNPVSGVVAGPQFWQTTEIEIAPALIDQTVLALNCHA